MFIFRTFKKTQFYSILNTALHTVNLCNWYKTDKGKTSLIISYNISRDKNRNISVTVNSVYITRAFTWHCCLYNIMDYEFIAQMWIGFANVHEVVFIKSVLFQLLEFYPLLMFMYVNFRKYLYAKESLILIFIKRGCI